MMADHEQADDFLRFGQSSAVADIQLEGRQPGLRPVR
jgi:hypothetical protein